MKALIVILIILSVGLGIALMKRHNLAVQEKEQDTLQITTLSNIVDETKGKLEEQEAVNTRLTDDLKKTTQRLAVTSNETVKLSTELAKAQADAKANAEAYQASQAENARRQAEIDKYSKQIDDQTKQLTDLNSAIDGLNKVIQDTERKLSASEGDRAFLLKELKRLQAEKAELERQFNDLAMLRSQVSKLREELSIAKRLDWIRTGLYGFQEQKGAEKLLLGVTPAPPARPGFDLNVELRQEGTGKVTTTNTPPAPK